MKLKNIGEAKNVIIESHKKCKKAMEVNDFKTNNKIILEKMNPSFLYLESKDAMNILVPFLKSDDIDFKIIIARRLLPFYEDIAINALNDIIKKKTPNKSDVAEIVLKEWKGLPM